MERSERMIKLVFETSMWWILGLHPNLVGDRDCRCTQIVVSFGVKNTIYGVRKSQYDNRYRNEA